MAWRSSGTSNDEMVDNLKRFGVIRDAHTEAAFRSVDRRFFVPQNFATLAHADQPLKQGHIHISAPHIYGSIVEALDLTPNTALSFLNIGSGTGYLSSIVAKILGPTGVCYGVEIQKDAVDHCKASIERWNTGPALDLPYMEFIHGNGLNIDITKGESAIGFDRIYVGASISKAKLKKVASLLRPRGVLVAPVDDELVKVIRLRGSGEQHEDAAPVPRNFRGRPPTLSEDFSHHVISPVLFAPLLEEPEMPTVVESRVWDPSIHHSYPASFKKSCKEIMLCSLAPKLQPPPEVPLVQINVASQLPRDIWVKVISFAQRDWFEPPLSEVEMLRRRLEEEQQALQRARNAQQDAEMRLRALERERDGYRVLALRWRTRLQAVVEQQQGELPSLHNELLAFDDISQLFNDPVLLRLGGINAIVRPLHDDSSEEEDEQHDEESIDGREDMEAESEDDMSTASIDDAPDALEAQNLLEASGDEIRFRPAKTVSITASEP